VDKPNGFPADAWARVLSEQIRGERDYRQLRAKGPPPGAWTGVPWIVHAFRSFILKVFSVFAHEVCTLGRQRAADGSWVWPIDRIRAECDEFLRVFTIHAYGSDLGYDHRGRRLPEMISNWGGTLLPKEERVFYGSDEWRNFQENYSRLPTSRGNRRGKVGGACQSRPANRNQRTTNYRLRRQISQHGCYLQNLHGRSKSFVRSRLSTPLPTC